MLGCFPWNRSFCKKEVNGILEMQYINYILDKILNQWNEKINKLCKFKKFNITKSVLLSSCTFQVMLITSKPAYMSTIHHAERQVANQSNILLLRFFQVREIKQIVYLDIETFYWSSKHLNLNTWSSSKKGTIKRICTLLKTSIFWNRQNRIDPKNH